MGKMWMLLETMMLFVCPVFGWASFAFINSPGPPPEICVVVCNDEGGVIMFNDFHIHSPYPGIISAVLKPGWTSTSDPVNANWTCPSLLHFEPEACDTFCIVIEGYPECLDWEITLEGSVIGSGTVPIGGVKVGEGGCASCEKSQALTVRPNPSNVGAEIFISFPQEQNITLEIRDILGRHIRTLISDEHVVSGSIIWNGLDDYGNGLPAGLYFYCLRTGSEVRIGKITLLK